MTMLLSFLGATGLIVALILLRLLAARQALQARIRHGNSDKRCEDAGCGHGCDLDGVAIGAPSGSADNPAQRSADHAP